jgi:hypothetical protein
VIPPPPSTPGQVAHVAPPHGYRVCALCP